MAVTVLGKRQRSQIDPEETLCLRSGSKRRSRAPRIHEEPDGNPFILSTHRLRSASGAANGPLQENNTHVKGSTAGNKRSKRIVQNENTLSPSKIDSHFKTSKYVNDENVKPAEFRTPSTNRFRDVSDIKSPVTPKHRVQVGAKALTPRTPRSASSPTATQSVYASARQLFARSSNSQAIIGRDQERAGLSSFIQDGINSRKGGCLYVSGPPGTGKSAMVAEVCRDLGGEAGIKVTHVNCVSMRTARDIFGKLIEELCEDSSVFTMSETEKLKSIFTATNTDSSELYLITLDEIDHLLSVDPEILYTLFEWSLHINSRLLLIGIANALDLTDRFLPRLKAKNLKPRLLPFLPYTAPQIANIITVRLKSLIPEGHEVTSDFVPFVQPAAIQLCAKKVASQTGDLRKAFDLVKRAIDVIEQETQRKMQKENASPEGSSKNPLGENTNLSSPPQTPASKCNAATAFTTVTAPRASIAHVARITSAVFGQGTTQRLQALNLQQKAALCALVALDRKRRAGDPYGTPTKSKSNAPTVRELFDTYCTLCRSDNILHPLTATEFKDVVGSLETLGLVGEFSGRGRGGTIAGGSGILRTPSKSGSSASTPRKTMDEQGLASFVTEREILSQISGPGEGILKALLMGDGL